MARENARKFEAEHKMWDDPLLDAYITDITQRIVAVAKPKPFTYRTRIVNDPTVNAFTFGGGLLYFHAGLVARMENEAQLAMVMAHEIAHVTERHVPSGIEKTYGMQLLGTAAIAAGQATGRLPLQGEALQKTYEYTMNAAVSGHGRSQESEADEVGMAYMVKAGYDPREAPGTFDQLLRQYGDQSRLQNFFYGSHPTNRARIERTTELARTRYAKEIAERKLAVNTQEFMRRTRELVVQTGKLDFEGKHFESAAAMFEKASRVDPRDPEPHHYLGRIALETQGAGGVDRAIGHFEEATRADDKYAPAFRDLGLAYYRKGERPNAVTAFERYLALDPNANDAARIKQSIAELKRQ
jgi:predicted Zn-dependent protease